MRKNGSRLISVNQYRATDLVVFALIAVVSELLGYFAKIWFSDSAYFTLSLSVPIACLVLVRWGWWAVFYPLLSGATYCLASRLGVNYFAVQCIGGMFVLLMLLPAKLIGVEKIRGKWIYTALFAVGAWLCTYLGRSVLWAICYAIKPVAGANVYSGFVGYALDLVSLFMTVVLLLVMRKLDGMFEDQKHYLKRVDKERRDKMRRDEYGDEPVEIDEETLKILNRDNDLYD
ncbi:MAG: hypothetical protein NC131_03840 [Roseburia sp.]|nr:hypothetical protein [Roseburia sp.]